MEKPNTASMATTIQTCFSFISMVQLILGDFGWVPLIISASFEHAAKFQLYVISILSFSYSLLFITITLLLDLLQSYPSLYLLPLGPRCISCITQVSTPNFTQNVLFSYFYYQSLRPSVSINSFKLKHSCAPTPT